MYYMIWKKTIQSQMSNKENEVLEVDIKLFDKKTNEDYNYKFNVNYISCKFDGFTILNIGQKNQLDIAEIKKLFSVGNNLKICKTIYTEQFTKPKPRLTEADLIKVLDHMGIGRPSTFASIIATLINRNYMEIKNTNPIEIDCEQIIQTVNNIDAKIIKKNIPMEKRKIFITELGKTICTFLKDNFKLIMDYSYTSDVNKKLDIISEGKLIWHNVVREQYAIFNPIVEKLLLSKPSMKDSSELIGEFNNIKYYKYKGKFGWTIKWNTTKKPQFLKIPDKFVKKINDLKIEDIEDIIPINLGKYKKYDIFIKTGQFGAFINWNKTNVSIKDKNISLEKAIELINNKDNNKKTNSKVLKEIKQYKVINGQYGIFITNGKKNKKLTDNKEIKDIDIKYCNALFRMK
jgi:DNA topoisomerase-1